MAACPLQTNAMPGARVFLDTNTLLYLHDRKDIAKGKAVQVWLATLITHQLACLNLQVLNEAASAMLRKRWFDRPEQVFSIIDDLAELGDTPVGWGEVGMARLLHARLGYSWWDCLLLASAFTLGCTYFLSEDMQDGQRIADATGRALTIIDPFAHSPEQILSAP
jgi:predicted nucleic acid-binding protein